MDKQRILKEAQKISARFSFWMVSGNISHLYGYVYESLEKKYDLEIKFDERFPQNPPQFIYYDSIKELLGEFQLEKLEEWKPEDSVVEILEELFLKVKIILDKSVVNISEEEILQINQIDNQVPESEGYITPDLNTYPPDFEYQGKDLEKEDQYNHIILDDQNSETNVQSQSKIEQYEFDSHQSINEQYELFDLDAISPELNTELSLIQQYYAFDQKGTNPTEIDIYLTVSVSNTFIVSINFSNYPQIPSITIPEKLKTILGDPFISLDKLKKWNPKKPPHIIDLLHEIENKLANLRNIEPEIRKIFNEYKGESVENSLTKINIQILTYGFKEYSLIIDLKPYPNPPDIEITPELHEIIKTQEKNLKSYKNWKTNESEPVEIIRELSWLVDKNSRLNFEINLLKEQYKDLTYDSITNTLSLKMKGKMKTQDIVFDFKIILPQDYPMKMPDVKVLNEFELETQEKIKNDLQSSFKDFFNQWTPYSYLVDLFNLISKKIFEVSVVACVICHKIDCPFCNLKIAGPEENCHIDCPHCERSYHKHCWEQTIKNFGKCGFCLKPPPPEMIF